MNYEPNTIHWKKGNCVIHDADAKQTGMLMRVIGYTRDGLCKTQYINREHKRTIYLNDLRYLHDPLLFGIGPIPTDANDGVHKPVYAWISKENLDKFMPPAEDKG